MPRRDPLVLLCVLLLSCARSEAPLEPPAWRDGDGSAARSPAPVVERARHDRAPASRDVVRAPPFRARAVDGADLDSARLFGRAPVVLAFFTSWCPACARALPALRRALDRAGRGVIAIGVALDAEDTWARAAPLARRPDVLLSLVRSNAREEIVAAYDAEGEFPRVVVIDRRGRVTAVQRGAGEDDGARLADAIDAAW